MADIASSDVTYTLQNQSIEGGGYSKNVFKLAFGDGALTYPSGGIPLSKPKLGVPNSIRSLKIIDQNDASGLVFKYDFENNKIRIYQSAGFTPAGTNAQVTGTISAGVIAVTAGTAGDAVTNNAGVLESTGGQDLAVEAQTFTGSTPVFTGTAVAAAAMAEFSGAVAAAVLYVEVVGY